ncbi:hypothetical protein GCM10010401_04860 [Rarobacter faecitabidus]
MSVDGRRLGEFEMVERREGEGWRLGAYDLFGRRRGERVAGERPSGSISEMRHPRRKLARPRGSAVGRPLRIVPRESAGDMGRTRRVLPRMRESAGATRHPRRKLARPRGRARRVFCVRVECLLPRVSRGHGLLDRHRRFCGDHRIERVCGARRPRGSPPAFKLISAVSPTRTRRNTAQSQTDPMGIRSMGVAERAGGTHRGAPKPVRAPTAHCVAFSRPQHRRPLVLPSREKRR